MSKLLYLLTPLLLTTFCSSSPVFARLNTITGGISLNYDDDKTTYDKDIDADTDTTKTPVLSQNSHLQQITISPFLLLKTKSSIDEFTIRFNPTFAYDQEESQNDIDHNLQISAYRNLTKRLQIKFSDNFIYSDDPELIQNNNISNSSEEPKITTDDDTSEYINGRKRYWRNDLSLSSTYTYAQNSSVGGGYNYRILQNDDTGIGGYENYDKHTGNITLRHQLNKSWNIDFYTSYTRGLFDPPDQKLVETIENELENASPGITDNINTNNLSNDLSEYRTISTVNWVLSKNKTFLATHSFTGSNYDALLRNDTNLHNLTFGARYNYSQQLSFKLGGGPSYEKTETFDANWDYNAHLNTNYNISKYSSISAGVKKSYDIQNFSQNNNLGQDQGLTDYWKWNASLSHKLTESLNTSFWIDYRDERQESILYALANSQEPEVNTATINNETFREKTVFSRKIYEAGASLKYSFLQWYTTSFRYTYRQQDSEELNDSYDEHRVFLTLSIQKELLRW